MVRHSHLSKRNYRVVGLGGSHSSAANNRTQQSATGRGWREREATEGPAEGGFLSHWTGGHRHSSTGRSPIIRIGGGGGEVAAAGGGLSLPSSSTTSSVPPVFLLMERWVPYPPIWLVLLSVLLVVSFDAYLNSTREQRRRMVSRARHWTRLRRAMIAQHFNYSPSPSNHGGSVVGSSSRSIRFPPPNQRQASGVVLTGGSAITTISSSADDGSQTLRHRRSIVTTESSPLLSGTSSVAVTPTVGDAAVLPSALPAPAHISTTADAAAIPPGGSSTSTGGGSVEMKPIVLSRRRQQPPQQGGREGYGSIDSRRDEGAHSSSRAPSSWGPSPLTSPPPPPPSAVVPAAPSVAGPSTSTDGSALVAGPPSGFPPSALRRSEDDLPSASFSHPSAITGDGDDDENTSLALLSSASASEAVRLSEDEELVEVFLKCHPSLWAVGVVKSSVMTLSEFYWVPLPGGWNRYTVLTLWTFAGGQLYYLLLRLAAIALPSFDRMFNNDTSANKRPTTPTTPAGREEGGGVTSGSIVAGDINTSFISMSRKRKNHPYQQHQHDEAVTGGQKTQQQQPTWDSWSLLEDIGKALVVEDVRVVVIQGLTFIIIGVAVVPPLVTHVLLAALAYAWLYVIPIALWVYLRRIFYQRRFKPNASLLVSCSLAFVLKTSFVFGLVVMCQSAFVYSALFFHSPAAAAASQQREPARSSHSVAGSSSSAFPTQAYLDAVNQERLLRDQWWPELVQSYREDVSVMQQLHEFWSKWKWKGKGKKGPDVDDESSSNHRQQRCLTFHQRVAALLSSLLP